MSRRRKSLPHPKRHKDLVTRQLHLVCTGDGTHARVLLDVFWVPVAAGRPDLESRVNSRTVRGGRLTACSKCNRPGGTVPDEVVLLELLQAVEPGRVPSWDVSTGRLLGGPPVAHPVADLGGNPL